MANEIIIDGKDAVLGRLAVFAAKQALKGKNIVIVNAESVVIIGTPKIIEGRYSRKIKLGHGVQKGPFISRKPTMILRRAIRGMLAHKSSHGREAYRRVKCYEQVPRAYSDKELVKMPAKQAIKFITLKDLSKKLMG